MKIHYTISMFMAYAHGAQVSWHGWVKSLVAVYATDQVLTPLLIAGCAACRVCCYRRVCRGVA